MVKRLFNEMKMGVAEAAKLKVDRENKFCSISGGVCSGLGKHFGVNPALFRLAFFLGFWFWGIGPLLYIILWIIMQ